MNNTASAQHVVELIVDSELTWTDWFGFQGDDVTEEVIAPQGILVVVVPSNFALCGCCIDSGALLHHSSCFVIRFGYI